MINNWYADMQHGESCLCERCLRDRRRAEARERVHAEIEDERTRQADMLAGALAALEEIAAINSGGAPAQVNPPCTCHPLSELGSHADWCPRAVPSPVLRSCDTEVTIPDLGRVPEEWAAIPVAPPYVYTGGADPARRKVASGPVTCPGCGFEFAGRVPEATACQYCGHRFPPLVTARPVPRYPVLAGPAAAASREAEEKLAPDPVRELTAAIREPLGLDGAALDKAASYTAVPAGCCQTCHQPVPGGAPLCWYCDMVHQAQIEADEAACSGVPDRGQNERAARRVVIIQPRRGHRLMTDAFLFSAGAALLWTGLVTWNVFMIIPGVALLLTSLLPWRTRR